MDGPGFPGANPDTLPTLDATVEHDFGFPPADPNCFRWTYPEAMGAALTEFLLQI